MRIWAPPLGRWQAVEKAMEGLFYSRPERIDLVNLLNRSGPAGLAPCIDGRLVDAGRHRCSLQSHPRKKATGITPVAAAWASGIQGMATTGVSSQIWTSVNC